MAHNGPFFMNRLFNNNMTKIMKKILSIFAGLVITLMASAQNYEYVGPFGMPYINLSVGGYSALRADSFGDFAKSTRPEGSLEIGTYFTPIWGASVEGAAFCDIKDRAEVAESTGTRYLTPTTTFALVNGKVNLSNLLGDYKGSPRKVEVVGVVGAGYGHNFAENAVRHTTAYNAGVELNFNLGEKRATQISIRPSVLWHNQDAVYPKLSIKDANLRLAVGLTYKFESRRVKSHNFVTNNYAVTQADYDSVLAKYEAEKNKPAEVKEVVKEVVKTERVVEKETKVLVGSNIITFPIGSCELSETEKAKVVAFAKSFDNETLIQVVGSADSKTGTEPRNFALAGNRAKVVKYVLTNECGIDESRISVDTRMDATDNVLTSRSTILTISVD